MEIRHFHYIRTIYEMGSISRAAEKLYISQPSLSQLLKSVEKKVGAPLFDRSLKPLRPTTIGQKYLETAQQIMELDTEFRRYVEDELGCAQGNLFTGMAIAKRIQAPPILAVSRRAYGFDHREAQNGAYYTRRYRELKAELLAE